MRQIKAKSNDAGQFIASNLFFAGNSDFDIGASTVIT